ncbi:hypothetical protein [Mariniplasma anaerobium]|uniref:Uncharacterized protein n=1 Tax=Mariniplasma anaerobium TaxID=2735436 RepID=A0A7U9XUR7_9MOLU|nr:hypothetical protein [Mariniplasma anaerobium]BCR35147.1 hypothetical protein MPAN_000400 [Mariniplasma anaerobium]
MKYTHLLPFMEKEELKKVAFEIVNGELKGVNLVTLYPFLDNETLDAIVDLLIEKKEKSGLAGAIPFLRKEKIKEIYEAAESGQLPNFNSSVCLPFLDADKIKEIFRDLMQKASSEANDDVEDESED